MTLESDTVAIETQLKNIINAAKTGVKKILFNPSEQEVKAAMVYPLVVFMEQDAEQNDLQVTKANQIGWNLNYEVTCIASGQTSASPRDARKFTHSVYDTIQAERTGGLLNNEAWDLNCEKNSFVTFDAGNKKYTYGGVITLIIQIFEDR